ncbi:major facilitator superfamily domain-containing protein [Fusarium avenaceum]|nr:major facilitator superfamily domain-containing protein [Fusarium avenaceum]
MSTAEKSPEPTGDVSRQDQSATIDTDSTRNNNDTTAVDIESSLAAWTCVFGGFLFLMPTFGTDYTAGEIGWIPGMYMFLSMLVAIQVGPVLDQRGPFAVSIIGGGGIVIMFILLAECKEYWQFMLCFGILGGLATAIAGTIGVTVVAKLFTRRRGLAIGLALAGSSIGTVIFPIMLRSLLPKLGWSWSMRVVAFVILGIFTIGILCLTPYKRLTKLVALPVTKKRGIAVLNFTAFRSVPFSLISVMYFAIQFVLYGIGGLLPTFAMEAGMKAEVGYTLLSIVGGASAFGRVIPGLVGDKLGHCNVLVVMMIITIIFMSALFVPFGDRSVVLYVFSGLWGFCSGGFLSITPVCVGKTCDAKDYGRYYGTLNFFISFSLLVSIPASGSMAQKMGTQALSGLLTGILALALCCLIAARAFLIGEWFAIKTKI